MKLRYDIKNPFPTQNFDQSENAFLINQSKALS